MIKSFANHMPSSAPSVAAPVSLAKLGRGQRACVVSVTAPGIQGEHLMEMAGLTPGTTLAVLQPSRWGHAMRLALRGGVVSLQDGHASSVFVQPLS